MRSNPPALYYRAISEAEVDAPLAAVQRARAAYVTVQRVVVTVTQEAIRVCGGRAFLRAAPRRHREPDGVRDVDHLYGGGARRAPGAICRCVPAPDRKARNDSWRTLGWWARRLFPQITKSEPQEVPPPVLAAARGIA